MKHTYHLKKENHHYILTIKTKYKHQTHQLLQAKHDHLHTVLDTLKTLTQTT